MYEATKTGKVGGNAVLFALQGKGTVPSRLSLPSTPTVLAAPEMWPSKGDVCPSPAKENTIKSCHRQRIVWWQLPPPEISPCGAEEEMCEQIGRSRLPLLLC
jgi:hypothetical protein